MLQEVSLFDRTAKFAGGRIDPDINTIDGGVGIGTVAEANRVGSIGGATSAPVSREKRRIAANSALFTHDIHQYNPLPPLLCHVTKEDKPMMH